MGRRTRVRSGPPAAHAGYIRTGLVEALQLAPSIPAACSVVVDHLLQKGMTLPSLYLERGGRLRCQAVRGYWQVFDGMPVDVGVIGSTYRRGRPTEIRGVSHSRDCLAATLDVVDEVCVPIVAAGRVVGALNVESTTELPVDALAVTTAAAAAFAARLVELGGAPPESPAQLLARHAALIVEAQELPQLWAAACAAARELTGSSSAAVIVANRGAAAHVACGVGPVAERLTVSAPAEALAAIGNWVASGSSCWTMNNPHGRGFPGSDTLRAVGAASALVVSLGAARPLTSGPSFLIVADEQPADLATDLVELLELLGTHVAGCARTLLSLAALRRQASRDPLTDLRHHASYQAAVAAALASDAVAPEVAVVMLDIDDFKAVNDEFGHPAGDTLLCSAARLLSVVLRDEEELYRIGGDEFATVLRVYSAGEALSVAERLRAAARAELGATVSIGVALAEPGEPIAALIARADRALYRVKRAGRDGVVLAQPCAAHEKSAG